MTGESLDEALTEFVTSHPQFPAALKLALEAQDKNSPPGLRARRWLFLLLRSKNPFSPHHNAATMVLEGKNESIKAQDRLARALVETVAELAEHVDPELAYDSPAIPNEAEGNPPMLAWDARAASYLQGLGRVGTKIAGDLRAAAAERWRTYLESNEEGPLWNWWLGYTENGETLRFMKALAVALWNDRVHPQLEAPALAPATTAGMAKVPKVVAPVSWAWGGGCLEAGECLEAIVQDGERYGVAPELARDIAEGVALLPKSHPLINEKWCNRPHQNSLPLGLGRGEQPLPVAMAEASAGGLLTPLASKLMLLAMADPRVLEGRLVQATVDELAQTLYPNAHGRIQPPARNRVVEAAEEMGGLHIYNPEALNMPRVFDVTARVARRPDGSPEPNAQIWLGFSKAFELAWPAFTRGRYAGEFLVNLTGALGLDNRRPALLRHYIRACAAWNAAFLAGTDGRFNREALPAFKPEDWGAMVNALSPLVVDYLKGLPEAKGRGTARAETAKARKTVMNDLECLAEQYGLIRLERTGRGKFKPLPPEGYIEAWEQIRKAGRRPKG